MSPICAIYPIRLVQTHPLFTLLGISRHDFGSCCVPVTLHSLFPRIGCFPNRDATDDSTLNRSYSTGASRTSTSVKPAANRSFSCDIHTFNAAGLQKPRNLSRHGHQQILILAWADVCPCPHPRNLSLLHGVGTRRPQGHGIQEQVESRQAKSLRTLNPESSALRDARK